MEHINTYSKTFFSCLLSDFIELEENEFVMLMECGALENGCCVGDSEINSWKANYSALKTLLSGAKLSDSVCIAFEYKIPIGGGRVDCMLFGEGLDKSKNIIHVELKQWSNENVQPYYDGYTFIVDGYRNGSNLVAHPLKQVDGYQNTLLNHIMALESEKINLYGLAYCYNMTSVENALIENYHTTENFFCKDQQKALVAYLKGLLSNGNGKTTYDVFVQSEVGTTKRLYDVAAKMLEGTEDREEFALTGDQVDVYNAILGAVKKTPKDQKTAIIVKGGPGTGKSVISMRLLSELYKDEYNCTNVFYATRSASLRDGWKNTLQDVARQFNRGDASSLIQSTYDFKPYRYGNEENGGDVLIVDEAHRIGHKANDQTDSHRDDQDRSYLPQILSMLYTSRICVFFIDDKQSIVSKEIGRSDKIQEAAENYRDYILKVNDIYQGKCKSVATSFIFNDITTLQQYTEEYKKAEELLEKAKAGDDAQAIVKQEKEIKRIKRMMDLPILEPTVEKVNVLTFELKDQFRCNSSNNYLTWLDHVLYGNGEKEKVILRTDSYEFDIYDTPNELYAKIRSLDSYACYADQLKSELLDGFSYQLLAKKTQGMVFEKSARIVAGWCWDWNTPKNSQVDQITGDLRPEVDLLDEYNFALPWETQQKPKGDFRYKYALTPESWCNQKEGVNQVGCIHSIQGWETDYIGVIIGPDLMWDEATQRLCYNPKGNNHNLTKKSCVENDMLILNTYRVLLTRGKKGCFVFACDPKVREYFKRCLNISK